MYIPWWLRVNIAWPKFLILFLKQLKPIEPVSVQFDLLQCTNEYSNSFLQILIFVFVLWQFSNPNIIQIFKYFCTNISGYWSSKITWNTWIKEFYFPFLTWRYILTTLLITMIISCWSVNPLNTGHLCKAELCMLFRKILYLCITNYIRIFEYF